MDTSKLPISRVDELIDKLNEINNNITNINNTLNSVDYIIEEKLQTDGSDSWYRLYKSGWVEQGVGPVDMTSAVYTFTFPIPMKNTFYTALSSVQDMLNTTTMGIKLTNYTTTSIQARNSFQSSGSTLKGWLYICGMSNKLN